MAAPTLTSHALAGRLVRALRDADGRLWFAADDAAAALGVRHVRRGLAALDADEWARRTVDGPDGPLELLTLSESGLYGLLLESPSPRARRFRRWLCREVLPNLRRGEGHALPGTPPGAPTAEMPPEALQLRPHMRQKLWQDALQTARLDGKGADAALAWFGALCRMMTAQAPAPAPARETVHAFFAECCRHAPGKRVAARELYAAFARWHQGREGPLPSRKAFGEYMQAYCRRVRSNGSHYDGIALK